VALDQIVDSTLPLFKNKIVEAFRGVSNTDVMNDKIADFAQALKEPMALAVDSFLQQRRSDSVLGKELDTNSFHVEGRETRNNKLRSRYVLPGEDTLLETWEQQLSDNTQADLFSWRTTADTGLFSSVHLDERRHKAMEAIGAGNPRPPWELEQRVGTAPIPRVWQDQQPVTLEIVERAQSQMVQARLLAGPRDSIALHDEAVVKEPWTGRSMLTTYRPVNDLEPGMRTDVSSKVDLQEMHEVGFRDTMNSWRYPREPEDDFHVQLNDRARTQELLNKNGFDFYMTF